MEGGDVICVDASDALAVLYTGYSPEEMKEKKKTERNIHLLKKEVEEHPDDYKMLAHLGGSYFQEKQYEEAARWYEEAVRRMPEKPGEESTHDAAVFKNLIHIYSELNREVLMQKAYRNGTRRFPKEADYDYQMGWYYVSRNQFQEGVGYLQRAIDLLNRFGSERRSTLLASCLLEAWEMLVLCYYEIGDFGACVNLAVTLLKVSPERKETLKLLLKAFRDDAAKRKAAAAPASQVLAFLGNLYDMENPEKRQFVLQAAKEAEYEELVFAVEKL